MLSWFPEREPPTGGIGATGILKLLGAPDLKRIEVLVRETVQNSWDAAVNETGVRYSLRAMSLEGEALSALRNAVFAETLSRTEAGTEQYESLPLVEVLRQERFPGIFITDSGTRGLGGPILPGERPSKEERTDFRDFFFKVGAPPTEDLKGGSYGFGKSIGYLVSKARCIVAYSKVRSGDGTIESRLMGAAVGKEYHLDGISHTGRHWWGVTQGEDVIAPSVGTDSDTLAQALGFRPEEISPTGTSILILHPDFEDSMDAVLAEAAMAITRNFWPKMVPFEGSDEPPMSFEVTGYEGRSFDIPHPDETQPLPLYAAALRAVRSRSSHQLKDDFVLIESPVSGQKIPVHLKAVKTKIPRADVGLLGIATGPVDTAPHRVGADEPPFELPSRGIALVRAPELIVRYEEATPHHAEGMEWGGLFKPLASMDRVFRDAEPPAHDDWHPSALAERNHQIYVRVGIRRLGEIVDALMQTEGPSRRSDPAWQIANELGDLLPGLRLGSKPEPSGNGRKPKQSLRRPKVVVLSSGPVLVGSRTVSRATFAVESPTEEPVAVEILAAVAAHEDGRREDPSRIISFGAESRELVPVEGGESRVKTTVEPGLTYVVHADFDQRLATAIEIRVLSQDEVEA